MAVEGYDGITFGVGDRVELNPTASLWREGARYGEVVGILARSEAGRQGANKNRVRVTLEGVKGVHSGPPRAFRLVYK